MSKQDFSSKNHMLSEENMILDLLASAKANVTMYAHALTESAGPTVRKVLTEHLIDGLEMQERIFNFAKKRGLYNAYDLETQLSTDLHNAEKIIET